MKAFFKVSLFQVLFLLPFSGSTFSLPRAGFYLPDSVHEVTFKFKTINNLVLLPVTINDSIHVNLILDTGCRNLVLFGKRFQKMFNIQPDKKITFSGLGSGKPVYGKLSIENKVAINAVLGENIPVVIVPSQNLFGAYMNVHGVIGYDIFTKFEVELNPARQLISFRPAAKVEIPAGFIRVPIRIEDSRPLIDCEVVFSAEHSHLCNLMIDTGSSLGLLLKTTELEKYPQDRKRTMLGRGLNGIIEGIEMKTQKLVLSGLEIHSISTGITYSPWHNYASVGMDILRDYAFVLNYCKQYAGFKKL